MRVNNGNSVRSVIKEMMRFVVDLVIWVRGWFKLFKGDIRMLLNGERDWIIMLLIERVFVFGV